MNLGAAILILGVTCFMIISRGFRAAVLILAACLVGLVILWGYNDRQRGKADRIARNAQLIFQSGARSRFEARDLTLSDVALQPNYLNPPVLGAHGSTTGWWTIEGDITNNSEGYLTQINFEVIIKDGARIIAQEKVDLCDGTDGPCVAFCAKAARVCARLAAFDTKPLGRRCHG